MGDVTREQALEAALRALVDEYCDYTKINQLGDPEQQHNIKLARAALAMPAAQGVDGPADRLRAYLAARDACDYDDDEIDYIVGATAEDVAHLLASDIRALTPPAPEASHEQ